MTTHESLTVERLLAGVRTAHAALIGHTGAGEADRRGLAALYEALAAGVVGLTDEQVRRSPSADEWSMAEVLEHVAEHDRKFAEFRRLGVGHYVEHGLEHALQLWRLRPVSAPAADPDGARPDGADAP